ncbi:glycosyltransferase [Pontixanthobacter gangjinensis]|uniref:Glycosyltransferase n=1 Tax=Christiangramia aestuarii TaxID=1028746 RepID=A0A7K1LLX7_9FLAO|nr:glycosyltransferase [Christiangramia aestuarii]MUP41797.1 glycosyltransferase [Christiangramia aestuarii]
MSIPLVSVFMLAYNQKDYINQSIESILSQRTDFPFELVIGDDKSTDGTREICENYQRKYPDKITLVLNDKNLGIGSNYVKTLDRCKGKYVAICDADDYWIDSYKIQKQANFLEKNQNFGICFTNNYNLFPSTKKYPRNAKKIPEISDFQELVYSNYIASVTVMFRNDPLPGSMKSWMCELPYCDWPTYLWVLRNNRKVYFMPDITAVYRKDFGTSAVLRNQKSKIGEINFQILKNIYSITEFEDKVHDLEKSLLKYKIGLISSYNKEKKYFKSFKMFAKLMISKNFKVGTKFYLYSLKVSIFES